MCSGPSSLFLNQYPNKQFVVQDRRNIPHKEFQPIIVGKRTRIELAIPALIESLKNYFGQPNEALEHDSEASDWLYHVAKRLLFSIREERLGASRAAALFEHQALLNWYDPHKGLPPPGKDLGPEPRDYLRTNLARLAKERPQRTKKIKLAHVVPLIVDGTSHAPSQLLDNLIMNHDRDRFQVVVITTEKAGFHPYEYPFNFRYAPSTKERAPLRIAKFLAEGVKTYMLENFLYYEEAARSAAQLLKELAVDIVVFHGPDVVNSMCAQLTDVPVRILFEHGTQPAYPGFDLVVVSSEGAAEAYREHFNKLHSEVRVLPFAVDLRSRWQAEPYSKEQLGLPEDSLVMTTISNHLASRLNEAMCRAIAEILKHVPRAYYAPMGAVEDKAKDRLREFFDQQGVENRVLFLGACNNPTQYARSMDLYLNEFPFGSCLALLDAMAAGCPIVTLYDAHGPQQARYGGDYFGMDRVAKSEDDYVNLACKLLTDPQMYQEWSDHAKEQYEKHADVKRYVKEFENIVMMGVGSQQL